MADRYWVGGSGTWNTVSTANWSATSGGAAGASAPAAGDNAIFNSSSGTGTVTVSSGLCANMDVQSGAGAFTFTALPTANTNYTFRSNTTVNGAITFTNNGTITLNGASLGSAFGTISVNTSGTVTLGGDFDSLALTSNFSVVAGTFNANNYNMLLGQFSSSNTNVRTVQLGTGTFTFRPDLAAQSFDFQTATNLTVTGVPNITIVNNAGTGTRGGIRCSNLTFGTVYLNTDIYAGSATGFAITGSGNTIGNIYGKTGGSKWTVYLQSDSSTNTFTNWNLTGIGSSNLVTVQASTNVTASNVDFYPLFPRINVTNRTSNIDYLVINNVICSTTTPVTFYAGSNSILQGASTGYVCYSAPANLVTYILTSGTSWTTPADFNQSFNAIYLIGGGGGGSGASINAGTGARVAGCGGGGGAFEQAYNVPLLVSTAYTYSIGARGTGGAGNITASASTGGTGGTTTINNIPCRLGSINLNAGGGGGGVSNATGTVRTFGAGGVLTYPYLNYLTGGNGGVGGFNAGGAGASGAGGGSVGGFSNNADGGDGGNATVNSGGGGAGNYYLYAGAISSTTTYANGGNNYLNVGGGTGAAAAFNGGGGVGQLGSRSSLANGESGASGRDVTHFGGGFGGGGGGGGAGAGNAGVSGQGGLGGGYGGGGGGGSCGAGVTAANAGAGGSGYPGAIIIQYFSTTPTFDTRYWVGGTGNWNSTSKWSTTSGGASGASVPTALTNVIFDANSGGGTVTIDSIPSDYNYVRSINTTGCTTTTFTSGGSSLFVSGNVTITSAVTYNAGLYIENNGLSGNDPSLLSYNAVATSQTGIRIQNAASNTGVFLARDYINTYLSGGSTFVINGGSLNTKYGGVSYNITADFISINCYGTTYFYANTSTLTNLSAWNTGQNIAWNADPVMLGGGALVADFSEATLNLATNSGTVLFWFYGGGRAYGNVNFQYFANFVFVYGANTFNTINMVQYAPGLSGLSGSLLIYDNQKITNWSSTCSGVSSSSLFLIAGSSNWFLTVTNWPSTTDYIQAGNGPITYADPTFPVPRPVGGYLGANSRYITATGSGAVMAPQVAYRVIYYLTAGTTSFTVPTNYLQTPNTAVYLYGAGGGGSGASINAGTGAKVSGCGGGGGGYTKVTSPTLIAGATYSCFIGTGGLGGSGNVSSVNSTGGAGGSTFFVIGGTTYQALGGGGGVSNVTGSVRTAGAAGTGTTANGGAGGIGAIVATGQSAGAGGGGGCGSDGGVGRTGGNSTGNGSAGGSGGGNGGGSNGGNATTATGLSGGNGSAGNGGGTSTLASFNGGGGCSFDAGTTVNFGQSGSIGASGLGWSGGGGAGGGSSYTAAGASSSGGTAGLSAGGGGGGTGTGVTLANAGSGGNGGDGIILIVFEVLRPNFFLFM